MAPNNQIFILIVVAIISLLFGAAVTLLVLHRRRRRQSQRLWRSLASLREKHRRLCQEGDPRYNEALSLVEASTANLTASDLISLVERWEKLLDGWLLDIQARSAAAWQQGMHQRIEAQARAFQAGQHEETKGLPTPLARLMGIRMHLPIFESGGALAFHLPDAGFLLIGVENGAASLSYEGSCQLHVGLAGQFATEVLHVAGMRHPLEPGEYYQVKVNGLTLGVNWTPPQGGDRGWLLMGWVRVSDS